MPPTSAADSPLPGRTVVEVLGEHARRRGEQVAITWLKRGETVAEEITYGELDRSARRLAAGLVRRGCAGQPVALALDHAPDFIRAFFGCLYAGAIAVPLPEGWGPRPRERARGILRDARPAAMITGLTGGLVEAGGGPQSFTLEALLQEDEAALATPACSQLAFLQYTSGSTRNPRGVAISHANLLASQEMMRVAFGHQAGFVGASWLPLHHDMGLVGGLLQPLVLGGHLVLMSPLAFLQKPVRWLRAIHDFRATSSGAPDFAYALCNRLVKDADAAALDLSCWRVAFCGAEPIRPRTLEQFARRFAASGFRREALAPCYGLAEATLLVSAVPPGEGVRSSLLPRDPDHGLSLAEERRVVDCGVLPPRCELAILDPENALRLPDDAVGEIAVAGPHVTPGYWSASARTAAPASRVKLEGIEWLRTGDLGFLTEGRLHVVGRLKDVIVVHGAKLHAEDVEATVFDLDLAGIAQVAVFPWRTDGSESFIVAAEVPLNAYSDGSARDCLRRLKAAVAEAHGHAPADVLLVAAGSLPRTSSGKIQRHQVHALHLCGELVVLNSLADRPVRPLPGEHPQGDPNPELSLQP